MRGGGLVCGGCRGLSPSPGGTCSVLAEDTSPLALTPLKMDSLSLPVLPEAQAQEAGNHQLPSSLRPWGLWDTSSGERSREGAGFLFDWLEIALLKAAQMGQGGESWDRQLWALSPTQGSLSCPSYPSRPGCCVPTMPRC